MGEECRYVYWSRLRRKKGAFLLFLMCFDSFISSASKDSKGVDEHLKMGMTLLGKGQYSDALSHFHSAIDADPNNYMSYYKRATVFLALSRSRSALADLDRVLEINSNFLSARLQRGTVLFKMGRLDEAHIDLEKLLTKDPGNEEASKKYIEIENLKTRVNMVHDLMEYQNYKGVIDELNELIEHIPWDPTLREMRADAYIHIGNTFRAISDIRSVTKLTSDNTDGYFKLADLYYQTGSTDESLHEVRECLKLDPEHRQCYPFYKTLKKVVKFVNLAAESVESQDWAECINAANKILKIEPSVKNVRYIAYDRKCKCLLENNEPKEAQNACSLALEINEEPRLYCDKAEAYLQEDLYNEAIEEYRKALNIEENFQRAKEGMLRAQKRQKQASKRDYYKNPRSLSRSASKRDVVKSYRKLAQKWHPDNFQEESEKKAAEKKFMDIAAAKEVLSDKELKEKYDNGEDPLDPEAQQGHHHSYDGQPFPFQGDPFGGARFKFHFN
ncbi:DNAJC3 [Lepeophtheirus salmonis]|uniref:DNAJC3 n=1 Tax=Lepeophtheirus salmonis TaxID=72036 RepID=A0A7R8CTK9_LEPSM|nr:DNAJC3 [Lepeophtheirus salmonis]CAF2925630.1 DNAJC3 [Lepeophtheirus salmonis]